MKKFAAFLMTGMAVLRLSAQTPQFLLDESIGGSGEDQLIDLQEENGSVYILGHFNDNIIMDVN